MDTATIGILIAIIGCLVSLAEWINIIKNDAAKMTARIHTLEVEMEHCKEKINELKEEIKIINDDLV